MIGRDCGTTVGRGMLPRAAAMSNTLVEQVGGEVRGLRYMLTPGGLLMTGVAPDTPVEETGLATGALITRPSLSQIASRSLPDGRGAAGGAGPNDQQWA